MKYFNILFFAIAITMLFYSCNPDDDGHQFITIVNKSDAKITVQVVHSSKITHVDTLWRCRLPDLPIETNSSRMFESANADRDKNWEDDFKYIPFIQFLIFDADVYDSMRDYDIPCEDVNYTIPVMHYYQLTLEDLQRLNWEVVYTGQ